MDLQVIIRDQASRTTVTGGSFVGRVVASSLAMILALVILTVAIPVLILAAVIGLAVVGLSAVRRLIANPAAPRDQRHNVRVRG